MTRESRYRACHLCEAICGLDFQFEGDRLVAIRGDPADPFSRGHICPKGNAILDLESDPDRLHQPMRRVGEAWHPLSWDEAFALAGERLAGIGAAHGADSVAIYLGNPNAHHYGAIAYLPAFLKILGSRNVFSASSVDQFPHHLAAREMYGHPFLLPIPDLDRTDYVLMLGANPMASMGSLMTAPDIARRLAALTRRGRLVTVDPRRGETAQVASEHHFIRPATDAWFLIALLRELRALGAPRLAHYGQQVSGLDAAFAALDAVPLADLQARTGIAPGTVARLAREFWSAPRAVAYGRLGVSTQAFGALCQWLLQLINLVSGNLDREGGALVNEPAIPLTGPGTSSGGRARWASRVRGAPEFLGELPAACLAEEIRTPGAGQVRALVTIAGNPVLSTPDGRALEAALPSLEFILAIDPYINETTRFAHLILPPASPLTGDNYDLIFNALALRRVARLNPPIVALGPDAQADWQILNRLSAAYCAARGRPWQDLPPPRERIAAGLAQGDSGLTLADLLAAPHGIDLGPLRPSLLRRLQTASGKIECAPPVLLQDLHRLRAQPAPAPLTLIGRRHIRSNNSWMHNAPRLVKGKPRHQLQVHPDDLARRQLTDGDMAILSSDVGSVTVTVEACADIMPGVVSLPHGFGHQRPGVRAARASAVPGVSYNDLTSTQALDLPSGNAAVNGVAVRLSAVNP
jgi:anaerobic selenocysteine-containing dehydrogenase